jgi:hypothetical protein
MGIDAGACTWFDVLVELLVLQRNVRVNRERPMPGTRDAQARQQIRGKGWRKKFAISADKYAAMSAAILKSLGKTPISFGDMVDKLSDKLESFDGSIPWYAISCLRELETQGKVTKHLKPVRYSKANRS